MANEKNPVPAEGEGNHEADRRYREDTKRFVDSGKVDDAARQAKQAVEEDPDELEEAEQVGKSRIAEEDPEVSKRT